MDGLRVQNGAYDVFAPTPFNSTPDDPLPPPQHGMYLIGAPVDVGETCFACDSSNLAAEIAARLDPVSVP
jgi:hypothetical protein